MDQYIVYASQVLSLSELDVLKIHVRLLEHSSLLENISSMPQYVSVISENKSQVI
ncbi:hypothetical protein GCM10007916_00520 [Psychromonas marina]|uniref:Uncharacterized protein n=1 Tax=Psychromonas marina TaxID=88364 RepID=A0ABQ6DVJ4_9GAMM|nr:hypothetical protein GCM10007916_00520 [Psychromonas marina]